MKARGSIRPRERCYLLVAGSSSPGSCTHSSSSRRKVLLGLMEERGGLVTAQDLEAYAVEWSEPVEVTYLGARFLTRGGLSGLPETLPRIPRLEGLEES